MSSPLDPAQRSSPPVDPKSVPLPYGFILSADKRTAEKVFKYKGQELKITVHFPSSVKTGNARNMRLKEFNQALLEKIGSFVIDQGLGTKKKEGLLNSISFEYKGKKLKAFKKHFQGSSQTKEIQIDAYLRQTVDKASKIAMDTNLTPQEKTNKKEKNLRKKQDLEGIVKHWKRIHLTPQEMRDREEEMRSRET